MTREEALKKLRKSWPRQITQVADVIFCDGRGGEVEKCVSVAVGYVREEAQTFEEAISAITRRLRRTFTNNRKERI